MTEWWGGRGWCTHASFAGGGSVDVLVGLFD